MLDSSLDLSMLQSLALPNPDLASKNASIYIKKYLTASLKTHRTLNKKNISWGSNQRESADIFFPSIKKDKLPVIFFIHGGYWVNGCKEMIWFMASKIIALPAIFVTLGYRLAPQFKFPTALEDCKKGLISVLKVIDNYGVDKDKLIISGHSVGGTLASLLALKSDFLTEQVLSITKIKACFPVSAIFDMRNIPEKIKHAFIAKDLDLIESSPLLYSNIYNTCPFYLFVGEKDFYNIKCDQIRMIKKLKDHNIATKLFILKNNNHFDVHLNLTKRSSLWLDTLKSLLNENDNA